MSLLCSILSENTTVNICTHSIKFRIHHISSGYVRLHMPQQYDVGISWLVRTFRLSLFLVWIVSLAFSRSNVNCLFCLESWSFSISTRSLKYQNCTVVNELRRIFSDIYIYFPKLLPVICFWHCACKTYSCCLNSWADFFNFPPSCCFWPSMICLSFPISLCKQKRVPCYVLTINLSRTATHQLLHLTWYLVTYL